MASMDYDQAAAERLEAVYLTADVEAQREHTLSPLQLKCGEAVLDIGSGPGFLCSRMGELVGPSGKVHGIDISSVMISRSTERNDKAWISFSESDATNLSKAQASYDVVVSTPLIIIIAQITRASLLASATAAILVLRRANNWTSQGRRVPCR